MLTYILKRTKLKTKFIIILFLLNFFNLVAFSQNLSGYHDGKAMGAGSSYNVTVSVTKIERNSALNSGGWEIKLVSVSPDSKGYFFEYNGKSRYYSYAELGNVCNPQKFEEVIVVVSYQCNNSGTKVLPFRNIGAIQKVIVRQDANKECNIKLSSVSVKINAFEKLNIEKKIKELNGTSTTKPNNNSNTNQSQNSNSNKSSSNSKTVTIENSKSNSINSQDAFNDKKQQVINNLKKQDEDFFNATEERNKKIERDGNLMLTSYYTAQAYTNSKEELKNLSKLNGSYESLEELNQAFQIQYNAISNQSLIVSDNSKAAFQSNADYYFRDADESGKALKDLAVGVNSLIADAKAEREAREAKEKLKAERERIEKEIKEKKWEATLKMRMHLLKSFPEGGLPLSSHKLNTNTVYCFAYALDSNGIQNEKATSFVSNVFPINKLNDDTWPYKNAVSQEIKKNCAKCNQKMNIVGYYTDETKAIEMQKAFIDFATKSNINIQLFTFLGKKRSSNSSKSNADTDFWETKNKEKQKQNTAKKHKTDFWND